MNSRITTLLVIAILGLTSCATTYNISSIQVEILSPAPVTLSEEMDTIAIFRRNVFQSDTITFKYHDLHQHVDVKDPQVKYRALANHCVDELARSLVKSGKFLKVINYRDTLMSLDMDLLLTIGADVFIFLDHFNLKDYVINSNVQNLGQEIFTNFPEFRKSTALETIEPELIWSVKIKGNHYPYSFRQPEKMYYGSNLYPDLFGNDENHRLLLQTAAGYLGNSFTAKLIPSMKSDVRFYYRSNNPKMLVAEKYLREGDWLKAAEIYNKETNNKNKNIVAKATFNMALICEMEENLNAATDWLTSSMATYKHEKWRHLNNCYQYNDMLNKRKKDLQQLEKQIGNYAEN